MNPSIKPSGVSGTYEPNAGLLKLDLVNSDCGKPDGNYVSPPKISLNQF